MTASVFGSGRARPFGRKALLLAPWLVLAGCAQLPGADSGPQDPEPAGQLIAAPTVVRPKTGHFTVTATPGWKLASDGGAVVLRRRTPGLLVNDTLLVRSAPVTGDWVETRTADLVVPATRRTLEALPEAQVTGEKPLARAGMSGAELTVRFAAAAGQTPRYARRHVVLVGKRNVYHFVQTYSSFGQPAPRADLDALIDSLREEA